MYDNNAAPAATQPTMADRAAHAIAALEAKAKDPQVMDYIKGTGKVVGGVVVFGLAVGVASAIATKTAAAILAL